MLSACYPERSGTIVFHQAPAIFSGLYALCKPFADPRTTAKFVFISGDESPGSANDATLREVIGMRWQELTGVGQPRAAPTSSPGYCHSRVWATVLTHVVASCSEFSINDSATSALESPRPQCHAADSGPEAFGGSETASTMAMGSGTETRAESHCSSVPCLQDINDLPPSFAEAYGAGTTAAHQTQADGTQLTATAQAPREA